MKQLQAETELELKLREQAYNMELGAYATQVRLRLQIISNIPFMRSDSIKDDYTKSKSPATSVQRLPNRP